MMDNMNETIELMHQHGSVRNYRPDPIARSQIETIVAAGQRAATSSNLQMYSAVVVQDAERRAKLSKLCGNQQFIQEAPVFIAWCADLSRLGRTAARRGYSQQAGYVENFLLAAVDTALAMQNAALAAESLGLGFCYIGAIRNQPEEVITLLGLPERAFPISGMTLGKPVRAPMIRPRLPLEAVLHWETYETAGEDQYLEAYDQAMIATGIYRNRQQTGESLPESDYGWQEHSARRVARAVRVGLRAVLEKQGFLLK
jgi:FMN reductase (NADPH)